MLESKESCVPCSLGFTTPGQGGSVGNSCELMPESIAIIIAVSAALSFRWFGQYREKKRLGKKRDAVKKGKSEEEETAGQE